MDLELNMICLKDGLVMNETKSFPENTYVEGNNRCQVEALVLSVGVELLILIHGGASHIGAVAVAEYYEFTADGDEVKSSSSVSLLTRKRHKEDKPAFLAAERIARETKRTTVVCCGIHLDQIHDDEIQCILGNIEAITDRIIKDYS